MLKKIASFHFFKNRQNSALRFFILLSCILFCIEMALSYTENLFFINIVFIVILPSLMFFQEIIHFVNEDYQNGVLEQWLGNNKELTSYIFSRLLFFVCIYILPVMVISILLFYNLSESLEVSFFSAICLFFSYLNGLVLALILGCLHVDSFITSILILTIQVPAILTTINAIQTNKFLFSIFICLGICMMSIALIFIFSKKIKNMIF
jgi:ABC-type transport system involved in cytochrome c biogenesis permease component